LNGKAVHAHLFLAFLLALGKGKTLGTSSVRGNCFGEIASGRLLISRSGRACSQCLNVVLIDVLAILCLGDFVSWRSRENEG
jgi:hypothetical protein